MVEQELERLRRRSKQNLPIQLVGTGVIILVQIATVFLGVPWVVWLFPATVVLWNVLIILWHVRIDRRIRKLRYGP